MGVVEEDQGGGETTDQGETHGGRKGLMTIVCQVCPITSHERVQHSGDIHMLVSKVEGRPHQRPFRFHVSVYAYKHKSHFSDSKLLLLLATEFLRN